WSACTTSPPTMPAPARAASADMPSETAVATAASVSAGQANPTTSDVGLAPIAATSARFTAAALCPTCSGLDQSSRKCTPCTSTSVVITTRPSGASTTAASSPGPTTVPFGTCCLPVTSRINPNSPTSATVPPTPALSVSRPSTQHLRCPACCTLQRRYLS